MKAMLDQIVDYFATKAVAIVLAKVQAGDFDQIITDKVDAIVAEMTEVV